MRFSLIALCTIVLFACGAPAKPISGYGPYRFGMSVSQVREVPVSGEISDPFSPFDRIYNPLHYTLEIEGESLTQSFHFSFIPGDLAGDASADTTLCGITVLVRGEREVLVEFTKHLTLEYGPNFKSPSGHDLLYEDRTGNSLHAEPGDLDGDGYMDVIAVVCVAKECAD